MASLHERSLFRTLRPTVPGLSAVEVGLQAVGTTLGAHRRQRCRRLVPAASCSSAIDRVSRILVMLLLHCCRLLSRKPI